MYTVYTNNTLNHLLDLSLVRTVEMSHCVLLMYRIVGKVHRYKFTIHPSQPYRKKVRHFHMQMPHHLTVIHCFAAQQFKAMISAKTSSEWLVYGLLVGEELPHQREDGYRVDPFAVTIAGHIPKILLLLHMLNWLNQVIQRLYMYQAISFTLDLSVPYVVKSVGA